MCGGVRSRPSPWAAPIASGVFGTLAAMPPGASSGAGSAAFMEPSATLAAWKASDSTRSTAER